MKTRTLVILAVSIGVIVLLAALVHLYPIWQAHRDIAAWSEMKYVSSSPAPELPIEVTGRRYEWHVRYPSSRRFQGNPNLATDFAAEAEAGTGQPDDIRLVNQLHMWKGAPVAIYLKTDDVAHSLFLPNFRIKQDTQPDKVIPVLLDSTDSNMTWDPEASSWKPSLDLQFACAASGDKRHSRMRGMVFVYDTKDDFLRWLKQTEGPGEDGKADGD